MRADDSAPDEPKRARAGTFVRAAAGILFGVMLAACETANGLDEANDPLEPSNRAVFQFNNTVDDAIGKPVARAYRNVLHQDIRDGIRNFVNNFGEPINLANLILQGKDVAAGQTLVRFFINSTVGVGGLGDVATHLGYPRYEEDFGQTLAVWGVQDGPYVMLPLLGPSNTRDVVGKVVDNFSNPFSYLMPLVGNVTKSVADGIDRRERNLETLEDIERNSLDYYAAIRSLYRQNRQSQIEDGAVEGPILDIPVYAD